MIDAHENSGRPELPRQLQSEVINTGNAMPNLHIVHRFYEGNFYHSADISLLTRKTGCIMRYSR